MKLDLNRTFPCCDHCERVVMPRALAVWEGIFAGRSRKDAGWIVHRRCATSALRGRARRA